MANIWDTNSGVYLGFAEDEELAYSDDRHICTLGPNGSGKTRRLLIPNLARLTDWSILVVDIKGELCKMTAKHRRDAGSEIIILNPFNALDLGSQGLNPIASLNLDDDFPDDALGQAEANIKIEGKEPHFSQAAQDLFAAIIMYVRLIIPNGSYADVRELLGLNDDRMRELVAAPEFEYHGQKYPGMVAAGILEGWEEIGIKAGRYASITPENREIHGVISTALVQSRWLDSRPVKRDLAGGAYDFTRMKRRPVTVYLILPARRLATHATWLRLIITCVVQALMKDVTAASVPCLLMLDEYYAIAEGGFSVIERNMAMFRGYGIKLWTVWQDLNQAQMLYGKDGFETFIANAGVLQSFAAQDLTTADYLSRRCGQTTRQLLSLGTNQSHTPGQPQSHGENESLGQIQVPLVRPEEIRNMDDGQTIILSHKLKGPVNGFLPYPTELRQLRKIMALDPTS